MVLNQKLIFCPKNRFIFTRERGESIASLDQEISRSPAKNANFLCLHIVSAPNVLIISRESGLELFASAHKID